MPLTAKLEQIFGVLSIKWVGQAILHMHMKLDMLPSQTAYPAGFETSTPDWPQFPCLSRKCDASVWITWIHLVT